MNAFTRRSQAGAVHTMWLVSIMILWLATLALLYVTNADIASSQTRAADAEARTVQAVAKLDVAIADHKSLSDVVGYFDATDISARANITALKLDLDAAKAEAGNVLGGPDSTVTVDQTIKALISAHQAALLAKQQADTALSSELADRAAADQRTASLDTQYKAQIAQLRQDLSDEQNRSSTQATGYDRQLVDLRDQQQASDDSARSTQRTLDEAQLDANRAAALAEAQIAALAAERSPVEPGQPDGEILAVSADGTVAWIDVGSRNALRPGTRFDVLRLGKGGLYTGKGVVEVRRVEHDMAIVGLLGEADTFDPILPGDVVLNPLFRRNTITRYYLLGEFPLSMSKEFVTTRLSDLGGSVDGTLGTGTDVLVLGHKNLADGEFAVELNETDEYRQADRLGMRIMRLDDLSRFLSF
ncbi:MAG: hypothetical protein DRQ55_08430 [Planctomycetota bacterium]|nr:MAG: hypothetical protein DRQ55_08430 [Planctomycetota bacterium]